MTSGSGKKEALLEKQKSDKEISSYMRHFQNQMQDSLETEENDTDGQLDHHYDMNDCHDIISKLFDGDSEFNYFKGKLKEYVSTTLLLNNSIMTPCVADEVRTADAVRGECQ